MLGNTGKDSAGFYPLIRPMVSGNPSATFPSTSRKVARDKNGTLHCVYTTDNPTEVFYTCSGDNGTTWSTPVDLSNSETVSSLEPTLALDKTNTVYVAWQEGKDIYWRRFKQNQWEEKARTTGTTDTSKSPVLVSDALNNIHLTWVGYTSTT